MRAGNEGPAAGATPPRTTAPRARRVWPALLCTLLALVVLAVCALAPRFLLGRVDTQLLTGYHSTLRQGGHLDMPARADTIEALRYYAGYYGPEALSYHSTVESTDEQWYSNYQESREWLYKLMEMAELYPVGYADLLYGALDSYPYGGLTAEGAVGPYSYGQSMYSLETGEGPVVIQTHYIIDGKMDTIPTLIAVEFGDGVLDSMGILQPDPDEMEEYLWNYITLLGLDSLDWEFGLYADPYSWWIFADSEGVGFRLMYGVQQATGMVMMQAVSTNQEHFI